MRKYHLAPEEYRLREICKETGAFICPVITYGDLTSLTVLNVFINWKCPTNFLRSKWPRKKIPSFLIKVVLRFEVQSSVVFLCSYHPKCAFSITLHDMHIYWTRVCTLREIQHSEIHTMSTQEKKFVSRTLKCTLYLPPYYASFTLPCPPLQPLYKVSNLF